MKMTTLERLDKYFKAAPQVHPEAYVSPHAVVMGDVKIGRDASVWPGVVLRADINSIEIGEASNIQDGTIVHLADDFGVKVGDRVTVGHGAILHACEIGDETLVGMGATVLDGAKIGKNCVIGARALVTKGTVVPDGSVVMGVPGRIVKSMDEKARSQIKNWALKYVEVARAHKSYFESLGYRCSGADDQCECRSDTCQPAKKGAKNPAKKSAKKPAARGAKQTKSKKSSKQI